MKSFIIRYVLVVTGWIKYFILYKFQIIQPGWNTKPLSIPNYVWHVRGYHWPYPVALQYHLMRFISTIYWVFTYSVWVYSEDDFMGVYDDFLLFLVKRHLLHSKGWKLVGLILDRFFLNILGWGSSTRRYLRAKTRAKMK